MDGQDSYFDFIYRMFPSLMQRQTSAVRRMPDMSQRRPWSGNPFMPGPNNPYSTNVSALPVTGNLSSWLGQKRQSVGEGTPIINSYDPDRTNGRGS